MTATDQYDNRDSVNSSFRDAGRFNSTYLTTEIKNLKPTEILDLSGIDKIIRDGFTEDFARGFVGIEAAPRGEAYFMSADIKSGKIFVNFATKDGFDAETSLVSAFEKLKNGLPLTQYEEYSVEALWHEILHNKSKNTAILPSTKVVDVGFKRIAVETINQLVARKTYPKFLKRLGGTAQHADWVLENGYAYNGTVSDIRKLIRVLNIDEDVFVEKANKLLMKDYTDFDEKISDLLIKMSNRKDSWRIKFTFSNIDIDTFDYHINELIAATPYATKKKRNAASVKRAKIKKR